ncbi:uncharacterized protein [Leptinotarsa decemlineata]|uniref:uncharacterized protein n=1 Tax=Leptinotarsa decemlineata TaxID=7539 RepID=UPI003D308E2B
MKYSLLISFIVSISAFSSQQNGSKIQDDIDINGKNHTDIPSVIDVVTIVPPQPTLPPNITTPSPPTTTHSSIPTSTSTLPPTTPNATTPIPTNSTTVAPSTSPITPPTTPASTTAPTSSPTTTVKPPASTTVKPEPERRFDGPSFIGGIVLALGLVAIGFVAFKFYKIRLQGTRYSRLVTLSDQTTT